MDATDRYLETRFLDANRGVDRSRLRRSLADTYDGLLPADQDARILDLGCGLGYFLDYLEAAGHGNRLGIDISSDCARVSGERHPVRHVTDVRRFLSDSAGEWDLVVMRHVIAHLARAETVEFIGLVSTALKPAGVLLVETFNGALPTALYTWANDFTHQHVFTEASLRQVLLLGGFDRVEVRPADPALSGWKGGAYAAARALYVRWLKLKFLLERGAGNNPTIFSKFLLAIATKAP